MENVSINSILFRQLNERAKQANVSVEELIEQLLNDNHVQESLLQQVSDAVITTDHNLLITGWNTVATTLYGWTESEALGQEVDHLLKTEWLVETQEEAQAILAKTGAWNGVIQQQNKSGQLLQIHASVSWIKNTSGEIMGGITINRNVTHDRQLSKLQTDLSHVLELIARDKPLPDVLECLVHSIEAYHPELKGAVQLLDATTNRLIHGVAPSLSKSYLDAIDGAEIGPMVGSCGAAAYHKHRVIVDDIQTSPLWIDFRDLAAAYDLRACWSQPIIYQNEWVLGTFALYYSDIRSPDPDEIDLIEMAAYIASIAIHHQQQKEILQDNQERLRGLSDASFESIFLSQDDICLDQNQTAQHMFGYTLEEAVGRSIIEWIVPEDRDRVLRNLFSSDDKPYQATALRKNGKTFPVEICGKIITFKGQSRVFVTAIRDISERIQIDVALRKSEARFRHYMDNLPGAVFLKDDKGHLLYCNQYYASLVGSSPEQLIGHVTSEYINNVELEDRFLKENQEVLSTLQPHAYEHQFHTKDGLRFWKTVKFPVNQLDGTLQLGAISIDITDLKQAEDQLTQSQQQFKMLAELMSDYVLLHHVNPDGSLKTKWTLGQLFEISTGYAVSSPTSYWDITHPDDIDRVKTDVERTLQNIQTTTEYRIRLKNGDYIWISCLRKPVWDESEQRVIEYYNIVRDITQRKLVEEKLRQNEERYRGVVEDIPLLLCRFLPDGEIVFVNTAYAASFQKSPDELVGLNFFNILNDSQKSALLQTMASLSKTTPVQIHEYKIIAPNGEVRWQRWTNRALFDSKENIIAFQSIGDDITEQQSMHEWLNLQSVALESAVNAIVIADKDGQIIWANPAFTTLTGYAHNEVEGLPLSILKSGEHDKRFYHNLWNTILSGQVWEGRIINRRKDGTLYTERQSITPIRNKNGKISHFIAIKQDITKQEHDEQLRLEQEQIKARLQKEQEYNNVIKRAISALSHDVRTPLAVIGTSKDLLKLHFDKQSEQQRRDKLDLIGKQLRYVDDLLEEVTSIVKSGLDTPEYKPTLVNLEILCKVTLNEIQSISGFQHDLTFTTDGNIKTVQVDEILVSRILLNLLSNAVKYSPRGGKIHLKLKGQNGWIMIHVIDQGVGIDPQDLTQIFEPFFRADAVKSIPGTGLGLNIVKECIERHNGRISVESNIGKGTTFIVELPVTNP